MFLLAILFLSAIVGLAAGGHPRGLLLERFRHPWLLACWLVVAAVPSLLVLVGFTAWPAGSTLFLIRSGYALISYGIPAYFLAVNLLPSEKVAASRVQPPLDLLNRAGVALTLLGVLATAAVVLSNSGAMPVSTDLLTHTDNPALQYGLSQGLYLDRVLIGPDTVLPWLARTIPLPLLPADPPYLSIGEIIVAAGLAWLVLSLMRPFDRWRRKEAGVNPPRRRSRRPLRGRRRS